MCDVKGVREGTFLMYRVLEKEYVHDVREGTCTGC